VSTHRQQPPLVVIRPTTGFVLPRLQEVWQQRELLLFFARRDIKVRYAQTILGWLWTFIQPVGMMLVFTLAFRKLGRVETDGVKYPIYVFSGLTFWIFFSRAVSAGADSLVANAQVLTKTACPRLLMPLSSMAAALFDFAMTFGLLLVFAALYEVYPSWRLALVIPVMAAGVALALGASLVLSAVNIKHRDIRNLLPLALQLLLFMSPIAYAFSTLGKPWTTLFQLNPLTGIVLAFRWTVVNAPAPSGLALAVSGAASVALLAIGLIYFFRAERMFADVV